MAFIHECALCKSHATIEYHSTYKGHPIEVGTSWITRSKCYHSNSWQAPTLAAIKRRISEREEANDVVRGPLPEDTEEDLDSLNQLPAGAVYHSDEFTVIKAEGQEDDPDGDARMFELEEVRDKDHRHVWTVVEAEGRYYALPGFHVVNRDHYRMTAEPWGPERGSREYVA
jgi:hypothetical protein